MERLKAETAAEHRRLEDRLNMAQALETREGYQRLLAGFYGMYEPLEDLLGQGLEDVGLDAELGWEAQRLKVPLLYQDLQALGASAEEIAALPRCDDLPALATKADILGCLYVVEGSTLGGQVISKMIRARLNLGPEDGAAFFSGYGSATGERWRQVCGVLEAHTTDEAAATETINSAKSTFEAFERWLTRE